MKYFVSKSSSSATLRSKTFIDHKTIFPTWELSEPADKQTFCANKERYLWRQGCINICQVTKASLFRLRSIKLQGINFMKMFRHHTCISCTKSSKYHRALGLTITMFQPLSIDFLKRIWYARRLEIRCHLENLVYKTFRAISTRAYKRSFRFFLVHEEIVLHILYR